MLNGAVTFDCKIDTMDRINVVIKNSTGKRLKWKEVIG